MGNHPKGFSGRVFWPRSHCGKVVKNERIGESVGVNMRGFGDPAHGPFERRHPEDRNSISSLTEHPQPMLASPIDQSRARKVLASRLQSQLGSTRAARPFSVLIFKVYLNRRKQSSCSARFGARRTSHLHTTFLALTTSAV
jgi:hypothetical protein